METECPVCLDDIHDKTIVTMKPCNHEICYQCIRDWNSHGNIVCPMCRAETLPTFGTASEPQTERKCEEQTNLICMTMACFVFINTIFH